MKILCVVGARPNFMKIAPVLAAIDEHNRKLSSGFRDDGERPQEFIQRLLLHTGQHSGELMSDRFFNDLELPQPDIFMGVDFGSHAAQTAEIMRRFEEIVLTERPEIVVVVGDVNSTLACALVVAKISFDCSGSRPLIAHVESGLRSFDRSMPEEINRILTDHVADFLFVTEESAAKNLLNEGIVADKIHFVGNTMIDSLLKFQAKANSSTLLDRLGLRTRIESNGENAGTVRYGLVTMHRPDNVDRREAFREILAGLEELAAECPIVFPVHPRTRKRIEEFELKVPRSDHSAQVGGSRRPPRGIVLTAPLGYLDFLCLMKHAAIVVTDSGGIQEETTCLGVPCVTVRENTERPVTVESGTNIIAGTSKEGIKMTIRQQLNYAPKGKLPPYWDGHAAARIIDVLSRVRKMSAAPASS